MKPKRIRGSLRERFLNYCGEVDQTTGCIPWLASCKPAGYGQIRGDKPAERILLAHRVAWQLFRGRLDENLEILHTCNNPRCVNPEHLEQATHAQNVLDASRDGLLHGARKFSKNDYDYIKRQIARGKTQIEIAEAVGCSDALVRKLLKGQLKNADAR